MCKNEEQGQIVVPARVFSQLIDFLPPKPVELENKNFDLLVKTQDHKSTIKGFNPEEFPIIPEIKEGESVIVSSIDFCQSLAQVVDISSPSIARPEISGIYFSFQKDLIKIVATDSFRLGEQKLFIKNNLNQDYSFILPQQAAKEVITFSARKRVILG